MRDRVVELRRVPAGELRADPRNWRTHPESQRSALAAMIDRVGMVDAVIARDTPEGLVLVDGHLRADMLDGETVPVLVVDLDDGEAADVLASLDPISAMAATDDAAIAALLASIDDPLPDLGWATPQPEPLRSYRRAPLDQLKPPIRIYGSKINAAGIIIAALPDDTSVCYVEPFAGMLAVLLARPPAVSEIANDLNGDVVAFWAALRDHPDELARRIAATPSSRAEYTACGEAIKSGGFDDPVERARCFAVRVAQSIHSLGIGSDRDRASAWSRHFSRTPQKGDWWRTQAAPYAQIAARLARVQLECRPAVEIIDAVPGAGGEVVYCDPPYAASSNTSPYRVNDVRGFEEAALAAADRGCRVAVSGYDGDWPLIAAQWPVLRWQSYTAQPGAQSVARVECLWTSYDPDQERIDAAVDATE